MTPAERKLARSCDAFARWLRAQLAGAVARARIAHVAKSTRGRTGAPIVVRTFEEYRRVFGESLDEHGPRR